MAREFCTFLDGHRALSDADFFPQCELLLARLHAEALALDDSGSVSEDNVDDKRGKEKSKVLYCELQSRFGERDAFWIVFDPTKKEEPIQATISDGLSDIYADLMDGLKALEISEAEAAWSWRFSHRTHWGQHALETLLALRKLDP